MEELSSKKSTPKSQLRWMKQKYENDEDYRQKQLEKAKISYQKNKDKLKERYLTDENYRNKIIERARLHNEKMKHEREALAEKKASMN